MAIGNGEQERKKAIVDRIQQILDNAKNIDDLTIRVEAPRDELTVVRYNVVEFIVPEDNL